MIKSKYCNQKDAECLVNILQNEKDRQNFMYGFMSAITFAYYKNLDKEDKELYCGEIAERVVEGVGIELMNEFCEEHLKQLKKE